MTEDTRAYGDSHDWKQWGRDIERALETRPPGPPPWTRAMLARRFGVTPDFILLACARGGVHRPWPPAGEAHVARIDRRRIRRR